MSARAQSRVAPERARRPQERNLKVVRRKSRSLIQRGAARRMTPLMLGGVVLVVLLISTVLLEQVLMAQSAFKLEDIRAQTEKAESRQQELILQFTRLENNDRIEEFARAQLGMVETNSATSEYMVADIAPKADARVARQSPQEELDLGGTAAIVTGRGEGP